MVRPSARLLARIRRDFLPKDVARVIAQLMDVPENTPGQHQDTERVQASIVLDPALG